MAIDYYQTKVYKRLDMVHDIMTVEECARYLKMSTSTIYKLSQEGKLPATKVGNQWRFRKTKIDQWLDERSGQRNGGPRSKSRRHVR